MAKHKFTVPVQLSYYRIACLLCSAWEGGSNYWVESKGAPYKVILPHPRRENSERLTLSLPVKVRVKESEDEGFKAGPWLTLNAAAIQRGLNVLGEGKEDGAAKTLADILAEDDDANTGDCFLQFCLFGKLVYG